MFICTLGTGSYKQKLARLGGLGCAGGCTCFSVAAVWPVPSQRCPSRWVPTCSLSGSPQAKFCVVACSAGSGAVPKALDRFTGVQRTGIPWNKRLQRETKPISFVWSGADRVLGSPGWPPAPGITGVLPHAQTLSCALFHFSVLKRSWDAGDY